MAGHPCCCQVQCDGKVTVAVSGVTNSDCAGCSKLNDTFLSLVCSPGASGITRCSVTPSTLHSYWDFRAAVSSAGNICSGGGGVGEIDSSTYVQMFADSGGQKYIIVVMAFEDDGRQIWLKQINNYTLPQTLTFTDHCLPGSGNCNFTSAEITVSEA